jgi:hypothetical protein
MHPVMAAAFYDEIEKISMSINGPVSKLPMKAMSTHQLLTGGAKPVTGRLAEMRAAAAAKRTMPAPSPATMAAAAPTRKFVPPAQPRPMPGQMVSVPSGG